ncbi:uncharacterized protein TNCV_4723841 [Trichonephila clavipes]|uniref:Uncharacterized protein n=1 Tax=Trichonephila clavipes TaxID=2585209 RepID=A0A8X6W7I2_TRICX|nr:uncharacterized protein TNCV_4723841 [Trichonephila clavipes]
MLLLCNFLIIYGTGDIQQNASAGAWDVFHVGGELRNEISGVQCFFNCGARPLGGAATLRGWREHIERTGEYFPPLQFTCRNCGGGDRGRVAIYRPFGEVSLSLNRTVTCMVLKANDRRTSCPCHDEFRGPRSDYVRQVALATTT